MPIKRVVPNLRGVVEDGAWVTMKKNCDMGNCWRYRFPMEFDVFPVVLLPTFHQVLDQIDSVVDDTLSEGFG